MGVRGVPMRATNLLRRFLEDESGATAIEYALIAMVVGVLAIGGLSAFGAAVSGKFSDISTTVANATAS